MMELCASVVYNTAHVVCMCKDKGDKVKKIKEEREESLRGSL